MSRKKPQHISGQTLNAKTELVNRSPTGEYLPRLGFAEDFLCQISIVNVQSNIYRLDPTPILNELKALPQTLRKQKLVPLYTAVVNHYSHFKRLSRLDSVNSIFELATLNSPEFEFALQEELDSIDPEPYANIPTFTKDVLSPLENLVDVYLGLLTLFFEATAILYPEGAATEDVIENHISNALRLLREKLRQTIAPGNCIQGSLLLQSFCQPDRNHFDRYLRYEDRAYSVQGVQQLVVKYANESRSSGTVTITVPTGLERHRLLADKLIELIDKFQALLKAKQGYKPQIDESTGLPAVQ
ncbi:hypothetical protein [Pseudomonas azotoformans]|uniref:hypothetical protein n=1 Tax=Pseudomonas azotoformans TaxID=47878 RepID=UPI001146E757|nr:hypothetical protein [Pseudomonas azotoformans]QDH63283.1 hypothetical protein FKZ69_04530 [Pseudomonas azotoformans]